MRRNTKIKIVLGLLLVVAFFNIFIYILDKVVTPTVMAVADAEMRAKSMEIINTSILKEYSKQFNYDDIIKVEKDEHGNISMLKADTLKMSKIASDVALNSQKELKALGHIGIKVPIGYIFNNNILANIGPDVSVKMEPIGYIETKYQSEFESAGINQTRHKIYVQVYAKVRIIIPTKKDDIEVKSEVPISETIIVGKTPDTSINLDLNGAGYKINEQNKNLP
ncbi:sporulation protein YunB [Clostridium sp. YIM B02515]|uniref:Sporulation protein YunB n=1 Tax=Clostridium rhizosphaerae TaxID=2803861 RepID=A0ABS1TFD5_9CLOT|nr:sporulation protein YunB [Clostridium rhizosphaerae]